MSDYKDLDFLNEIECKLPVNEWKLGDMDAWPWIRMYFVSVFHKTFTTKATDTALIDKVLSHIRKLYNSNLLYFKDYNNNDSLHNAEVIFWGANNGRTIFIPGKGFFEQDLDAIRLELEKRNISTLFMEQVGNNNIQYPRSFKSVLADNTIMLQALKSIVLKKDRMVNLIDYDKLFKMAYDYGANNFCLTEDYLTNIMYSMKVISKRIAQILKKCDIKLGIVDCWYSGVNMAFCYACRRVGIPCIDIQHGLAGAMSHIAYARWSNCPNGGYSVMPSHFWCWTQEDADAINEWFPQRAFVGGRSSRLLWNKNSGFIVDYYNNLFYSRYDRLNKFVLLTLQPGCVYPEYLFEVIKEEKNVIWLVRQHPNRDKFQEAVINRIKYFKNVEIKLACSMPLDFLLNKIILHITLISSVVIDALDYGVNSVILDNVDRVFEYKEQIKNKQVFVSNNKIELSNYIKYFYDRSAIKTNVFGCERKDNYSPINEVISIMSKGS